jgi:hypothetical protein
MCMHYEHLSTFRFGQVLLVNINIHMKFTITTGSPSLRIQPPLQVHYHYNCDCYKISFTTEASSRVERGAQEHA